MGVGENRNMHGAAVDNVGGCWWCAAMMAGAHLLWVVVACVEAVRGAPTDYVGERARAGTTTCAPKSESECAARRGL